MKLLTRYNRINLATTVVVLFITGIIYYGAISFILNHQVDKDIRIEQQEILNYIKQYNKLPPAIDYKDQHVTFYDIAAPLKRHYTDTDFYNKKENEYESARALIISASAGGTYHKIVIVESKVETEDLIRIIFIITIGVILFLLLVLFITNRFILNRIWQPFYNMLNQLKLFSLSDNKEIRGADSAIDEFIELNKAVEAMSVRVKKDYKDLKAFTENASHELLTPIAVINSKLDSLIQAGEYNETQSKLLADVYGAVTRLTRLNQSLLLLVKIENRLVTDEQEVDFKLLLEEKLSQFKELFHEKELVLHVDLHDKKLNISRYLADILLNNLLSNAIRHNYVKGEIQIQLDAEKLIIKNTGLENPLVEDEILKRFNKSPNSEGIGLGLTITRQICDNYKYGFGYRFSTPYHIFTIVFNN